MNARFRTALALLLLVGVTAAPCARAQTDSFGSATNTGQGALIGILYDLKQNQQREPTRGPDGLYIKTIKEFVQSNWDEDVLNRYFRVTRPVYSTQIFIPNMSADQAPKAFGVSDLVKPRLWVVHYKGQVAPPEAGIYRFSGDADDVMAVRVNDRLVLVAGFPDFLPPPTVWSPSQPATGNYRYGNWISLKAGETVDFDVIVGERPGGSFHARLCVEKQGASTTALPPLLKLAPSTTTNRSLGPDTTWSVWSAKQ